jgi:phosphoglucomutase
MQAMMDQLHTNPPMAMEGHQIKRVEDYTTGIAKNADGTTEKLTLPSSEVLRLFLDDGSWIAVRPSGTEPKIKFYVEAVSTNDENLHQKAFDLSKSLQKALGI